jgi:hypothetical protein
MVPAVSQEEEDLLARRVALREATSTPRWRPQGAFLYCTFFVFHAASVLLLFLSYSVGSDGSAAAAAAVCRRSWIPSLV